MTENNGRNEAPGFSGTEGSLRGSDPQFTSVDDMKEQLSQHSSLLSQLANVPTALQSIMSRLDGAAANDNTLIDEYLETNPFDNFLQNEEYNDNLESEISNEPESGLWQDEEDTAEGPPLLAPVADAMRQITEDELSKEKLDKVKSRTLIPSNCSFLGVPKVNPELWGLLNSATKANDVKAQGYQQLIAKSLCCMATLTSELVQQKNQLPREFFQKSVSICRDGVMLLTAAQRDANFKRMQNIKPNINQQYIGICNTKPSGTSKYLFGDSLSEKMKESKSLSGLMRPASSNTRYHPYRRPLNFRGQPRFQSGRYQSFSPRGRPFNQRPFRLLRHQRQ